MPLAGGADESTPPAPQGEYAQSVLGRERMFEHASHRWGTKVALLRLNYAIDLRYGVLVDIARAVFERRPVDVRMPLVNVIWQGDANSVCLRSHCALRFSAVRAESHRAGDAEHALDCGTICAAVWRAAVVQRRRIVSMLCSTMRRSVISSSDIRR